MRFPLVLLRNWGPGKKGKGADLERREVEGEEDLAFCDRGEGYVSRRGPGDEKGWGGKELSFAASCLSPVAERERIQTIGFGLIRYER